MKSKNAQGLSLTTIIVSAIALIVLVLLVLIFTGKFDFLKEEFNPETNVCLEWKTWDKAIFYGDEINGFEEHFDEFYIFHPNFPDRNIRAVCIDWEKKDTCELDPTNEELCICDEWEFPNCPKYKELITNEHRTNPTNYGCPTRCSNLPIEINGKRVELECYSNNPCISAHSPSPCELEDEHYVLDCEKWDYYKLPNKTYECEGKLGFGRESFCRLKEINDYSCQDLLYYILGNKCYNTKKDKWAWDCSFLIPPSNWINWIRTKEIVDTYKEKGCLE